MGTHNADMCHVPVADKPRLVELPVTAASSNINTVCQRMGISEENVATLTENGVTKKDAQAALVMADGNLDVAEEWLFKHGTQRNVAFKAWITHQNQVCSKCWCT